MKPPRGKRAANQAFKDVHTSTLKCIVLAAAILGACNSGASEALARKSDCLACHAVATKLAGPAFKDVAAKYAGQSDAADRISESIRNGGVGKWGELPMPAQSKLSAPDAKKLALWILNKK